MESCVNQRNQRPYCVLAKMPKTKVRLARGLLKCDVKARCSVALQSETMYIWYLEIWLYSICINSKKTLPIDVYVQSQPRFPYLERNPLWQSPRYECHLTEPHNERSYSVLAPEIAQDLTPRLEHGLPKVPNCPNVRWPRNLEYDAAVGKLKPNSNFYGKHWTTNIFFYCWPAIDTVDTIDCPILDSHWGTLWLFAFLPWPWTKIWKCRCEIFLP